MLGGCREGDIVTFEGEELGVQRLKRGFFMNPRDSLVLFTAHLREHFLSTALLLNEVSEKSREISNKVSETFSEICFEICPEIHPDIFVLSWQVEQSSSKISPDFSHRKFQSSNRIPNQISPKISQTHFCRLGSPNMS